MVETDRVRRIGDGCGDRTPGGSAVTVKTGFNTFGRIGGEDQAIGLVSERLQAVFSDRSRSEVEGVVARVTRGFATARIRAFVPLLVERISRDELNHRFAPAAVS